MQNGDSFGSYNTHCLEGSGGGLKWAIELVPDAYNFLGFYELMSP